jgi:hypothetical protein
VRERQKTGGPDNVFKAWAPISFPALEQKQIPRPSGLGMTEGYWDTAGEVITRPEPIHHDAPWRAHQERQAVATRRKPAERFLRCEAARPDERDAEQDGRHFGRNDRWLLARDKVACAAVRATAMQRCPWARRRAQSKKSQALSSGSFPRIGAQLAGSHCKCHRSLCKQRMER